MQTFIYMSLSTIMSQVVPIVYKKPQIGQNGGKIGPHMKKYNNNNNNIKLLISQERIFLFSDNRLKLRRKYTNINLGYFIMFFLIACSPEKLEQSIN